MSLRVLAPAAIVATLVMSSVTAAQQPDAGTAAPKDEKAYSLPVKLSVPLMICVFPVLFVVILLPVVVRIKMGAY